MNIKLLFAFSALFCLHCFPILLTLLCYHSVDALKKPRKLKRRGPQECKRQVDALSLLLRREVSRLDTKDTDLMGNDNVLKDETRQVDRKYQMEVNRLNGKIEGLTTEDNALMNKVQSLDEKDDVIVAKLWKLVQRTNVLMEWVTMAKMKLEEAHEKIVELRNITSQTTEKLATAHEKIDELQKNNTLPDTKLDDAHQKIEELQNKTKLTAAFDGSVTGFNFVQDTVVMPYDQNTDEGSFFDETMGCFEAPCNGVYQFSLDFVTSGRGGGGEGRRRRRSGHRMRRQADPPAVILRIDEEDQGDTLLFPDEASFASCTVVRNVEQGKKVDVLATTAGSGNLRFSGHLIKCQH